MNHFVNIFQSRRRDSRSRTIALPSATDSLSSSSDGSVPTPEDDPDVSVRSSNRFANWLRSSSSPSKPSSSSLSKPKSPYVTTVWSPPPSTTPQESITIPSDSDDDSDNYGEDNAATEPLPMPPLPMPPPIPASSSIRASSRSPGRSGHALPHRSHQNLRDITLSAINQRPPCPPFIHAPPGPVFPRSSNSSRLLPTVQTTRLVHHKMNLVRRLEAKSLSPAEHESIAPFYNRSKHSHSVFHTRRRLDLEDVSDLKDAKRVQDFSHGLQRWINRPCFEERCVAWYWDSDGIEVVFRPISGSGKAVALLEFSEGIEAMAGISVFTAELPSRLSPLSIPPIPRLDIQITGSSSPSPGPPTPKNTSPSVPARKTLRFTPVVGLPDDDGDNVPLGFHLSKRGEQEREEKKRKALAEEVAKARMRADAVRTGAADRENLHDRRQTYSRPLYDTHASLSKLETAKQAPEVLDVTKKPSSIRSSTWNGDISRNRPSPAHLSPHSDSEVPKSQRRSSVFGSAFSDVGGHTTSNSRPRSSVASPPPVIPVPPLPMVPTMPVYPFQLQPMMPVSTPMFMQSRFMPAPSSLPNFDPFALPLPPPIRAGIPVTRSAERLAPSAYSTGRPPTSTARRMTASTGDMQKLAEQMKRGGFHREQLGRPSVAKTDSYGRSRDDRNQPQHNKPTMVDSRSQSGRTDESKRYSRMPSAAVSLTPKQSATRLISR